MMTHFNALERDGQTVRVRGNRRRCARLAANNVFTSVLVIAVLAYILGTGEVGWIVFQSIVCALTLPLSLYAAYLNLSGTLRTRPDIAIEPDALRFLYGSSHEHRVAAGDLRELVLMPSKHGQTLIVIPADERAFFARAPWPDRLCRRLTRLYCGHSIGLTPNLAAADFVAFTEALDLALPNRVSVLRKAHPHPLLGLLLGNVKRPATPLPVSLPPPLGEL